MSTPNSQVKPRPPRHAAVKNEDPKCTKMLKKKTCTDQKCRELKNRPQSEPCHHTGPFMTRITPVTIRLTKAMSAIEPNM